MAAEPNEQTPFFLLSIGDAPPIVFREGTSHNAIDETPEATLQLNIANSTGLIGVDLYDEARLEVVKNGTKHAVLTGVISAVLEAEQSITIELRGTTVQLHERHLAVRNYGVPNREMISYVLTLSGLPPERQDIQGLSLPKPDDTYLGIVPLEGFSITGEYLLGRVLVYGSDRERDNEDRRFDGLLASGPVIASTSIARARVTVNAGTFLDADSLIRDEVNRALDWIAFRATISEPLVVLGDTRFLITWDRTHALAMPYSSPIVYSRRESDNAAWVREALRFPSYSRAQFTGEDFLGQTRDAFATLLSSPYESLSDEERALLLSLHWYRRARQDERLVDRIVDYWTSIEYILRHQRVAKLFTKDEQTRIKVSLALDWQEEPARLKALEDAIDAVNDSPLPRRLEAFIKQYAVPVTENDSALLRRTRGQRNDIVHGRSNPTVTEFELSKLGAITERFILRRAFALGEAAE